MNFAGVMNKGQAFIMDWRTGELLFDKMQGKRITNEDPDDFVVYSWATASVSDDPARLAVEMKRATSVFDATGNRIWWCDIRPNRDASRDLDPNNPIPTGRYLHKTRHTLSADGQTLGVVLTKYTEPYNFPEFAGVLLYKISDNDKGD